MEYSKICSNCNILKPTSDFYKNNRLQDGYFKRCKECIGIYQKEYFNINKDKFKEYQKEYFKNNKDKIKEYQKEYFKNNKDKFKEYYKEYNKNNKDKIKEYQKEYFKNNKDKMYENQKKYNKKKYHSDPQFKTISNIRCRLNMFLKTSKTIKTNKTIKTIGINKKQLNRWIQYNIDIDDLSDYQIDHVRPLSSFELKSFKDVVDSKCNHWTNLMPLSPEDNRKKYNREPTKHELFKIELRSYIFSKIL